MRMRKTLWKRLRCALKMHRHSLCRQCHCLLPSCQRHRLPVSWLPQTYRHPTYRPTQHSQRTSTILIQTRTKTTTKRKTPKIFRVGAPRVRQCGSRRTRRRHSHCRAGVPARVRAARAATRCPCAAECRPRSTRSCALAQIGSGSGRISGGGVGSGIGSGLGLDLGLTDGRKRVIRWSVRIKTKANGLSEYEAVL